MDIQENKLTEIAAIKVTYYAQLYTSYKIMY